MKLRGISGKRGHNEDVNTHTFDVGTLLGLFVGSFVGGGWLPNSIDTSAYPKGYTPVFMLFTLILSACPVLRQL